MNDSILYPLSAILAGAMLGFGVVIPFGGLNTEGGTAKASLDGATLVRTCDHRPSGRSQVPVTSGQAGEPVSCVVVEWDTTPHPIPT